MWERSDETVRTYSSPKPHPRLLPYIPWISLDIWHLCVYFYIGIGVCVCVCVCVRARARARARMLSRVWLFATSWTVARQVPCPWDFPGRNIGVGCPFFLQGIFPTQRSNLCLLHLLHWQVDSFPLCHLGSPIGIVSCVVPVVICFYMLGHDFLMFFL